MRRWMRRWWFLSPNREDLEPVGPPPGLAKKETAIFAYATMRTYLLDGFVFVRYGAVGFSNKTQIAVRPCGGVWQCIRKGQRHRIGCLQRRALLQVLAISTHNSSAY
jgi:hypothetical protein